MSWNAISVRRTAAVCEYPYNTFHSVCRAHPQYITIHVVKQAPNKCFSVECLPHLWSQSFFPDVNQRSRCERHRNAWLAAEMGTRWVAMTHERTRPSTARGKIIIHLQQTVLRED